jgi:hypothetical protein
VIPRRPPALQLPRLPKKERAARAARLWVKFSLHRGGEGEFPVEAFAKGGDSDERRVPRLVSPVAIIASAAGTGYCRRS